MQKITLLNICLNDKITRQRPVIEVPGNDKKEFREFVEDKDSGFRQLTGEIITLKLLNGKFTRKRKVKNST